MLGGLISERASFPKLTVLTVPNDLGCGELRRLSGTVSLSFHLTVHSPIGAPAFFRQSFHLDKKGPSDFLRREGGVATLISLPCK